MSRTFCAAGPFNCPGHPGRLASRKGYIGSVSTKTHSGDPDGTGGFGGFLGSGRFLALKFRIYEKIHRQNWLEIVGKQKYGPRKGLYRVVVVLVVPRVGSGTGLPPGQFRTNPENIRNFYELSRKFRDIS